MFHDYFDPLHPRKFVWCSGCAKLWYSQRFQCPCGVPWIVTHHRRYPPRPGRSTPKRSAASVTTDAVVAK
eukprot:12416911-Karenia_brevis.AAC.1